MSSPEPRPSIRSNVRGFCLQLLLLLSSQVIALIVLELALRMLWSGFYLKGEPYAIPHATRGWANLAQREVIYGEAEFKFHAHHNSIGFRGPEFQPKSGERTRILMLGDSFTYGIGVEDDETFSSRLMQLAPSLEVLNGGVNGYGTGQELIVLEELGERLRPDLVMVGFFWNDVANNVERDVHRFELVDGELVYPEPQTISAETLELAMKPRRREWLRYSYLYRFVSDRLKIVNFWAKMALGIPHEDGDRLPASAREQAWNVQEALLVRMKQRAEALGSRLALLVIPEQVQVQPDAHVLGLVADDYEIQERIKEIGRRHEIPVIDLLPRLRDTYAANHRPLYYRSDRHMTSQAHAIAAEEILKALERYQLLPNAESRVSADLGLGRSPGAARAVASPRVRDLGGASFGGSRARD